jgi:hypothetical protein
VPRLVDDEERREQLLRLSGSTEEDAAPRVVVTDLPDGVTRIDVADTAVVRPGEPDRPDASDPAD